MPPSIESDREAAEIDPTREAAIDCLLDAIQFHIWADARREDVESVIDSIEEAGPFDHDKFAIVRVPRFCSAEAQPAVDAFFANTRLASTPPPSTLDRWRCINCKRVVAADIEPEQCLSCNHRTFALCDRAPPPSSEYRRGIEAAAKAVEALEPVIMFGPPKGFSIASATRNHIAAAIRALENNDG